MSTPDAGTDWLNHANTHMQDEAKANNLLSDQLQTDNQDLRTRLKAAEKQVWFLRGPTCSVGGPLRTAQQVFTPDVTVT